MTILTNTLNANKDNYRDLVMLDGYVSVEHLLCCKFSKALNSVSAMFNAQVQVWRQIQQSWNWLDVTILTFSSKLHSDDRSTNKLRRKRHQMANYWFITTHLWRHLSEENYTRMRSVRYSLLCCNAQMLHITHKQTRIHATSNLPWLNVD